VQGRAPPTRRTREADAFACPSADQGAVVDCEDRGDEVAVAVGSE
jgi:hypothetical protein